MTGTTLDVLLVVGTWAIALVAIFGEPLKALFLPPKLEHGADHGRAGRPAG